MSNVIDRRPLNEAVADMLVTATGRPIGRSRIPTDPNDDQVPAEVPYAIVYPILGGEYWGSLTFPEDAMGCVFQITAVGLREDQAQWLADKARQGFLGRDSTGAYQNPISVAGVNVVMRSAEGPPGGPMQESKIWQVVDRYKVTVSLR